MVRIPFRKNFWKSKEVWYLIFFAFVLLNLFSKFYYLPEESIYGDEAYSIYHAQKPLSELRDLFLHDQNPPMQIVTLHFWMMIFGVSDFSAKSLSVILSVLCAIVLFFFSKKFLNKEATIIVCLLFLLSNVQLFYSHEARVYPLVQFLCISSFYFYFDILNKPTKGKVLLLALVNFLLLFSHYLSIFILLTQFLCVWMYVGKNRKAVIHYLVSGFLVVALFLPWAKVMFANLPKSGSFWLEAPHFGELKFFIFWLNGNEFLFYIFSTIILSSVVMIFLNKRFQFFIKEFDVKIYIIFLVWYLLPIALDYIIAQFSPVFLLRYFLYSSIGLCLLTAYIIANLNMNIIVRVIVFLPLLGFLLLAFDAKPQKEDDWRSLVSQVRSLQNKKTIILVSASYKFKDFCFYYDPEAFKDYNNSIKRLADEKVYCSKGGPYGWQAVNMDSVDQVLFVQAHRQFEDPEEKIKQNLLDNKFKICNDYIERNIALTIFKRDGKECCPIKIVNERNPTKDDFWKIQTGIREQLHDTVLVFKTDMEPNPVCQLPIGIVKEVALSGSFANKINKENQYSVGIAKTARELRGCTEISIDAQVYYESTPNGKLIISVEKSGQIFYWQEMPIFERVHSPKTWTEILNTTVIPKELGEGDLLKVYFWNQDTPAFFIDDFKITFAKALQ